MHGSSWSLYWVELILGRIGTWTDLVLGRVDSTRFELRHILLALRNAPRVGW